jgi:predicted nucleotidyltransferase component of viral defense system
MSVKIIQDRLNSYKCRSELEEEYALREIMQEVAVAAIARTDFFKLAAFQGGTCLRIFYGLNRFSEDLDFILKAPNKKFVLDPYLKTMARESEAYGYKIEIVDRSKTQLTVRKAFLKDDSVGKVLNLTYLKANRSMRKLRIKLEVDTNPPAGGAFEARFYDFPFAYSVTLQDLPSLFAGKIHALLCRQYAKGRDWYDFIWYTSRSVGINYPFLASALKQQGPWQGQEINVDKDWCLKAIHEKICSMDWTDARNDVKRFIVQAELPSIELWSREFFLDRLNNYAAKN